MYKFGFFLKPDFLTYNNRVRKTKIRIIKKTTKDCGNITPESCCVILKKTSFML